MVRMTEKQLRIMGLAIIASKRPIPANYGRVWNGLGMDQAIFSEGKRSLWLPGAQGISLRKTLVSIKRLKCIGYTFNQAIETLETRQAEKRHKVEMVVYESSYKDKATFSSIPSEVDLDNQLTVKSFIFSVGDLPYHTLRRRLLSYGIRPSLYQEVKTRVMS